MNKSKKNLLIHLNFINLLVFLVLLIATVLIYYQVVYKESSNFRLQVLNDTEMNVKYLIEDKQRHIAMHPITIISILESDLTDNQKRDLIDQIILDSPDLYGVLMIDEDHKTTDIYPYMANTIGYNIVADDLIEEKEGTAYFTNLVSDSIYQEDIVYYVLPHGDGNMLFAHKINIDEIMSSYNIDLDNYFIKIIDDSNKILYSSNGDYVLEDPILDSTKHYVIDDDAFDLMRYTEIDGTEHVYISTEIENSTWRIKVSTEAQFIFGSTLTNILYPALFFLVMMLSLLVNFIFIRRNMIFPLNQFIDNMNIAKEDISKDLILVDSKYDILNKLEENFIDMKDAISERDANLREFAYIASHDLQEPLRMITSYIEILKMEYDDTFDEDGEKYLNYIVDGSLRMKQLIQDLLQYSRSDRFDIDSDIDLNQLVKQVVENMGYSNHPNVKIHLNQLPVVKGNQTALTQVFQNLISNGVKFNLNDPIINITYKNHCIYIEDNGIGFDSKYIDKVFKPFQRLNSKKDFKGTGIGLSIVKKVIEKHGWKIRVTSVEGEGTKFIINMEGNDEK